MLQRKLLGRLKHSKKKQNIDWDKSSFIPLICPIQAILNCFFDEKLLKIVKESF